MSLELHVFLDDAAVPNCAQWQSVIAQCGFPTILDTTLDPRNDAGFIMASFAGKETGFELYLEIAADVLEGYRHLKARVGSRDCCATFRFGRDIEEMFAAMTAAAALTKLSDGRYYFPDEDVLYNGDQAVEAAQEELDDASEME